MYRKSIKENNQIIHFRTLRRLIGWIGLSLPLILILGLLFTKNKEIVQDSISDYYATSMRDFFVGFLFVLGFFLLSYKGYKKDYFAANLGALFSIGVAICPTTHPNEYVRIIHFSSAILLFLVFVYFCLVIFRRGEQREYWSPMKFIRNKVYSICGIIILLSLIFAGVTFKFIDSATRNEYNIIFWLEALGLWAFGFSWLTKGGLFFKDEDDSIKLLE